MVVHGHNQEALLQVAGERNFWIFRPNPHDEPRPESLRIFAHAHDTVEALLLQIANHWPDLHVINWELISVNDRIYTSLELQQGDYCLLVWSPQDLFAEVGSGVIMVENQVWNVAGGTVTTTVWKDTSINEFLDVAGYGRQCDLSPCPLFQDGDLALYGDRLRLYDADYVVIMQLEDAENARVVIYDPTIDELPVLERTPTTFEDHVRQTSIQQGILRAEDYALEAWRFSWAMTVNARKIFKLRRMILTQGQDLMVFPCRHGPAGFSLVKHSAFRDPFGLLFALKEVLLVEEEVPWKLMEVHPSVMAASISRNGKVMGILEEDGRDSLNEVFVLLERTLRPRGSQEETFHNYMSLWTDKFFELHDFLRQQGMFALCQIHECTMRVNGDRARPLEHFDLDDGAFLQMEIQLRTETCSSR